MKADYKNWMPKGMINGFCSASVVCLVALWIIEFFKIISRMEWLHKIY